LCCSNVLYLSRSHLCIFASSFNSWISVMCTCRRVCVCVCCCFSFSHPLALARSLSPSLARLLCFCLCLCPCLCLSVCVCLSLPPFLSISLYVKMCVCVGERVYLCARVNKDSGGESAHKQKTKRPRHPTHVHCGASHFAYTFIRNHTHKSTHNVL